MKTRILITLALICSIVTVNVLAAEPKQDPYNYTARGKYTFSNEWLYSVTLDNFTTTDFTVDIATGTQVWSMVMKDGKLYFPKRDIEGTDHKLLVVDAETGMMLDSISLQGVQDGPVPFADIQKDAMGNILVGNLFFTNYTQSFQVWKVDLATGATTPVIDYSNFETDGFTNIIRFNSFGVWGNVDGDGYIMAANTCATWDVHTAIANRAWEVYKWTITNGVVAAKPQRIPVNVGAHYYSNFPSVGADARVLPIDANMFYLHGVQIFPAVVNMNGNILGGIGEVYANSSVEFDDVTEPGTIYEMKVGYCGIAEFQIGNEYFVVMAATNEFGSPPSTFRLFKKTAYNDFSNSMEVLWTFPAKIGMGTHKLPYHSAIPSVEVDEVSGTATIAVYVGENGYGVYTLKVNEHNVQIRQTQPDQKTLFVYPNLTSGVVHVKCALQSPISIYSLLGKLVHQFMPEKEETSVDMSFYPNGVYIFKAENQAIKIIKK